VLAGSVCVYEERDENLVEKWSLFDLNTEYNMKAGRPRHYSKHLKHLKEALRALGRF